MNQARILHVISNHPLVHSGANIPDNFIIFNAPRPIYASYLTHPKSGSDIYLEWDGNFLHGRFYTAVNPNDERLIDRNIDLDAWKLEYHSEDEIVNQAIEYYSKMKIDIAQALKDGDYTKGEVVETYLNRLNSKK